MIRATLERLARGRAIARHLPRDLGGGRLFVSPDARLSLLLPGDRGFDEPLLDRARTLLQMGQKVWDIGAPLVDEGSRRPRRSGRQACPSRRTGGLRRVSVFAHPLTTKLRTFLRRSGVLRRIARLLPGRAYEHNVMIALRQAIGPSDIVWDVGANIGHYTIAFARSARLVVAFEPSPSSREELAVVVAGWPNVRVLPFALGDRDETRLLFLGPDPKQTTSSLICADPRADRPAVEVLCRAGDGLVKAGLAAAPTVVKIDVEGAERSVLLGMRDILRSPTLHTVLVEVHFALLAQSGAANAPCEIESLLRAAGFATRWISFSHLLGTKPR